MIIVNFIPSATLHATALFYYDFFFWRLRRGEQFGATIFNARCTGADNIVMLLLFSSIRAACYGPLLLLFLVLFILAFGKVIKYTS